MCVYVCVHIICVCVHIICVCVHIMCTYVCVSEREQECEKDLFNENVQIMSMRLSVFACYVCMYYYMYVCVHIEYYVFSTFYR